MIIKSIESVLSDSTEGNKILCIKLADVVITEKIALNYAGLLKKGQDEASYPLLIDLRDAKYITGKAFGILRDEFDSSVVAFLTSNHVQSILCSYFCIFNTPAIVSQIFTDKRLAINWLKNYGGFDGNIKDNRDLLLTASLKSLYRKNYGGSPGAYNTGM